jgi:hypothetical protein
MLLDLVISQNLSKHWKLRFTGKNLLNAEYQRTYGDQPDQRLYSRNTRGVVFGLLATYEYQVRSLRPRKHAMPLRGVQTTVSRPGDASLGRLDEGRWPAWQRRFGCQIRRDILRRTTVMVGSREVTGIVTGA